MIRGWEYVKVIWENYVDMRKKQDKQHESWIKQNRKENEQRDYVHMTKTIKRYITKENKEIYNEGKYKKKILNSCFIWRNCWVMKVKGREGDKVNSWQNRIVGYSNTWLKQRIYILQISKISKVSLLLNIFRDRSATETGRKIYLLFISFYCVYTIHDM